MQKNNATPKAVPSVDMLNSVQLEQQEKMAEQAIRQALPRLVQGFDWVAVLQTAVYLLVLVCLMAGLTLLLLWVTGMSQFMWTSPIQWLVVLLVAGVPLYIATRKLRYQLNDQAKWLEVWGMPLLLLIGAIVYGSIARYGFFDAMTTLLKKDISESTKLYLVVMGGLQ